MTETPPLVAGETLIDFVPETAEPLAAVERFDRRAGGAPANVAVGLARLGRTPQFWTRVGADPFGDFLADRLAEEGIPERFVERDDEAATTLAFVSGADEGPRFSFYRDGTADTRLQDGTVPDEALDSSPLVHAGGVALADEPARSATLDLLDRATAADCTVSFDPNVRPELWANDAELATICGWAIEETDVLIATPDELETLGYEGDDPETLASAAAEDGPHTVVLTMGEVGALALATGDAPWGPATERHEGYAIDAVDDTGAGDAFSAGLIDALDRVTRRDDPSTASLGDALAFANAVAAMSTTERGAMEALPTKRNVEVFLES
ncbi:sugar kinase, ribokinase [Salinarchaeum sp. Harcht-Bsk1]|uniref:carbohydrate kinase family protein n=1 Tax=Salinarchaeum sp. Harcht-Bsk1 TaxID=1333523 RepID=UPI0003423D94|nr:carbohydrate kinase [Salinarchaeum sp. Harcht-Bsk1]AGN00733.1 sugar kinase, ribokinase [Salinarchaeum sp. Harcht-Bsk1]